MTRERLALDIERTETAIELMLDRLNPNHIPNIDEQIRLFKKLGIWNPYTEEEWQLQRQFGFDQEKVKKHFRELRDALEAEEQARLQKFVAENPPTQGLFIHSAFYGKRDVTHVVKKIVKHNRLQVQVSNRNMGGDPHKGIVKTLTISYHTTYGKQGVKTVQFREGSLAILP